MSLQDISTSNNPDIGIDSYSLISKADSWAAMEFTHFEWSLGLDYRGLPFDSEYNVLKVSKNIIPYLRKKTLRFAPMKDVIQHAHSIVEYNHTQTVEKRRRFEEFGEGPWEYVLFPGRFDHKTLEPKYLPPLYQRSSDGEMLPLTLDAHNYDSLPRVTLMVHPAIVILVLRLHQPDVLHSPQSLKENVISPLIKIVGAWPHWSHNRFKPEPISKRKRRRSEPSDTITCKCTLCAYDSSSESSSSTGTYASDTDSSDSGERVVLPAGYTEKDDKFDLDVAAWAQKVTLPLVSSRIIADSGESEEGIEGGEEEAE
ncbi:hypothetical protein MPER_12742 [Moniliophthora perniciosa FA553]|nr:hypothetical protein MPER_12742 [Moniliophthora perniciosa FA553]